MRAFAIVASVLALGQEALAVSLRAANASAANTSADASQALDAVMSMVGAMQEKEHRPQHSTASNGTHRARLDVGFTGYEQNLTQGMTAAMRNATQDGAWTEPMRQRLIANVTASVVASINEEVKPVKQSVGKTWMALPEDDQKNEFVSQLRLSFDSVFADSLGSVLEHFQRGIRHVGLLKLRRLSEEELLAQSCKELSDSIIAERCYGSAALLQLAMRNASEDMAAMFNTSSANISAAVNASHGAHKKFCLPTILSNLVTRLNDAQGLLGMSMRFSAGAMDLVQTRKQ